MKKLLFVIAIFALSACSANNETVSTPSTSLEVTENIENDDIDWNHGLMYTLNNGDDDKSSSVIVRTDSEDMVLSLVIAYTSEIGSITEEDYASFSEYYTENVSNVKDVTINYSYDNYDEGYLEHIIINFYKDNFNLESALPILEYIGLNKMLDDGSLYLTELINSSSFSFRDIIVNGELSTNLE